MGGITKSKADSTEKSGLSSILLDMATRFYEGILTGTAEEQVSAILSEAARLFEADIATWFLVTEDRTQLRLVDVYNDLGLPEKRPQAGTYTLNWDAKSEREVQGLTAWAAISGEPLYVPSIDSLLRDHGKCHAGKWDEWLYPGQNGVHDPESGFLCMYVVPLFSPLPGPPEPKETVVGVLRMERRNMKGNKKRKKFSQLEIESINVIARIIGFAYFHSERQKSLTLADIGHTLIRPLGDVAFSLDTISSSLTDMPIRSDQIEHTRVQIDAAARMLRSLSSMLLLAKESYRTPLEPEEVDICHDLSIQRDALSLQLGRKIAIYAPHNIAPIKLTKRSLSALMNIALHLLQNAAQNSPPNSEVAILVQSAKNKLILEIENTSSEVPNDIIKSAMATSEITPSFAGLPRSYQLAARNGWDLEYLRRNEKNVFRLVIPIQSHSPGGDDGRAHKETFRSNR